MNWNDVVQKVTPYVVKIETPQGHGTGFVCFYTDEEIFCAIATALHLVAHADRWQEPLRIHHHPSNTMVLLKEHERFIFSDVTRDSAVMLVDRAKPYTKTTHTTSTNRGQAADRRRGRLARLPRRHVHVVLLRGERQCR